MIILLGLVAAARAAEVETLRYSVRWLGIEAGVAEVRAEVEDGVRTVTVTSRSAPWLAAMYPVDDRIVSESRVTGGAVRYRTWFREGTFQQDQDMRFGGGGVTIHRHQLHDGAWADTDAASSVPPAAEDPVSAFFHIRGLHLQPGIEQVVPVYNGRRTVDVRARCADDDGLRRVALSSAREGDFRGAIDLFLDGDDVPVRASVQTRAGTVWLERVP